VNILYYIFCESISSISYSLNMTVSFYINTQMASLTLNLSIGDLFTPLKNSFHSLRSYTSKDTIQSYVRAFDMFALRTMAVIILLATIVLTIMCVPYAIHIIENLITSLSCVPQILSRNPRSSYSLIQIATLLPLIFLLSD
jgi:hypothetical protein